MVFSMRQIDEDGQRALRLLEEANHELPSELVAFADNQRGTYTAEFRTAKGLRTVRIARHTLYEETDEKIVVSLRSWILLQQIRPRRPRSVGGKSS